MTRMDTDGSDSLSALMSTQEARRSESKMASYTSASHGSGGGAGPAGGSPLGRSPLGRSPSNLRASRRHMYDSPRSSGLTPRGAGGERKLPAYGSFYRSAVKNDSPGPGSYSPSDYKYNKQRNAPQYTLRGKKASGPSFVEREAKRTAFVPGPGSYKAQSSFGSHRAYTKSHLSSASARGQVGGGHAPSYSFGTAAKLGRKRTQGVPKAPRSDSYRQTQGPGRYNHKSSFTGGGRTTGIGVVSKAVKRAPSFGFGTSSRF